LLQLKNDSGKYSRTRDAEIYEKWSQALASGVDLICEAGYAAAISNYSHVFTLVLPVVVLPPDSLWQVEYNINGQVIGGAQRIDEVEFYVGRSVLPAREPGDSGHPYVFSHLHFVTLTGFASLLLRITQNEEWLQRAFDQQVVALAKAERLQSE
jgi:hypothetical protein